MTPQRYLFEAPALVLVLFAEWRYPRTGGTLHRTLARRWPKMMLALFAVGVVTGTILSFELGLLWPVRIQDFGNVFGLGFTLEASLLVEAIFTGIYAYGWDRLKPRLHLGPRSRDGRAVNAHPWPAWR